MINKLIGVSWQIIKHSWSDISICFASKTICSILLDEEDVTEENQNEKEDEAMVYAKLIASAPDLLEALSELTAYIGKEFDPNDKDDQQTLDRLRDISYSAIKKATT